MGKRTIVLVILATAAAAVTTVSCKKVIRVDLNNAASQIVIEGEVTNGKGPY